jgi:hypothetical protein
MRFLRPTCMRRWVEREAVLDPRSARWAGSITLGETELRCDGAQPVPEVKAKLQEHFGVAAAEQRLGTEEGKLMADDQTVPFRPVVLEIGTVVVFATWFRLVPYMILAGKHHIQCKTIQKEQTNESNKCV